MKIRYRFSNNERLYENVVICTKMRVYCERNLKVYGIMIYIIRCGQNVTVIVVLTAQQEEPSSIRRTVPSRDMQ